MNYLNRQIHKIEGILNSHPGARGKGTGFLWKVIKIFWEEILKIAAEYYEYAKAREHYNLKGWILHQ